MRKILVIFLAVFVLFVCVACGGGQETDVLETEETVGAEGSDGETVESETEGDVGSNNDVGDIISGTVIATPGFGEGLALVNIEEDTDKTYCIDTDFRIVFILDNYVEESDMAEFFGGFATLSGTALCDRKGNVTTAEELGVTSFPSRVATTYEINPYDPCDMWRKDGYIIAQSTEGAVKKMGVLDASFHWVVEPCEEMYQLFEVDAGRAEYIQGGYFRIKYFEGGAAYVDIRTLAVTDELPFALPSENWQWKKGGFVNYEGEVMLDMTGVSNVFWAYGFKDGLCAMDYYEPNTGKMYFNLINEKGEFLFEPIERDAGASIDGFTDKTILVLEGHGEYSSYDLQGNFLGHFSCETLLGDHDDYFSIFVKSFDGDVMVVKSQLGWQKEAKINYWFYNNRFELIR